MSSNRELTTTSISIPTPLLEQGKAKATRSFRTFSQYVSLLIDQDLNRKRDAIRVLKQVPKDSSIQGNANDGALENEVNIARLCKPARSE